ncbi:hypothetical protein BH09ACT10_BH09ACT10_09210 [soil metagenome]
MIATYVTTVTRNFVHTCVVDHREGPLHEEKRS